MCPFLATTRRASLVSWIPLLLLLQFNRNVDSAPVNPRGFRYYPRNHICVLIRFDEGAPVKPRDFSIYLDIASSLAYLGYFPLFVSPKEGSTLNANGVVCLSKQCYVDKSKESHIELRPKDFDVVTSHHVPEGVLQSCNMSYTFGVNGMPAVPADSNDFSAYVCVHPCHLAVPPATTSAEAMRTVESYSLIVVPSEYSRKKYLSDLHPHLVAAEAVGVSTPIVKSIRQPVPEDLHFEISKSEAPTYGISLRVCAGIVEITKEWKQVLSKLVRVYNNVCQSFYQSAPCELVLLSDFSRGVDASLVKNLKQASSFPGSVSITIIGNLNNTQIQKEIRQSHLYVSLPDAPAAMRYTERDRKIEYNPPQLVDPYIIYSYSCGVTAIALNVGASSEMMPAAKVKRKHMLFVENIEDIEASTQFVINRLKNEDRKEKFLTFSMNAIKAVGIRSVVSTIGKVMQKYPFVSQYDSFVKRNIHSLRKHSLSANPHSANVAVCVEASLHRTVEFAIRNVMLHLGPDWALVVFHSRSNEFFIKYLLRDITGIRFLLLEDDFTTRMAYSAWMKTPALWQKLSDMRYRHALLFQSDSLMLRSDINQYLQYDYIGAPWCTSTDGSNKTKGGVGNGGFSLRNISAMLRISLRSEESKRTLEDLFFVSAMEEAPTQYRLPAREIAYEFARELICVNEFPTSQLKGGDLTVPLGLHAAWLFSDETGSTLMVREWLNRYFENSADQ